VGSRATLVVVECGRVYSLYLALSFAPLTPDGFLLLLMIMMMMMIHCAFLRVLVFGRPCYHQQRFHHTYALKEMQMQTQ
jgi:hypothetical protein